MQGDEIKEMLGTKNIVIETKNAFDELIRRQRMADEKNLWDSEYDNRNIQNWKTKIKKKRLENAEQYIQELWVNYKKCSCENPNT